MSKKNYLIWNPLNQKERVFVDIESYNPIQHALPHDLSIIQVDSRTKKPIKTKCLLSILIFANSELEENIFFKDKLPMYWEKMEQDDKDKTSIYELVDNVNMCLRLNDIIDEWKIKNIIGYNICFDYDAINRLYQKVNKNIALKRKEYKRFNLKYKNLPHKIYNGFRKINVFCLYCAFTLLIEDDEDTRLEYYAFCIKYNKYSDSLKCISSKEEAVYQCFVDVDVIEMHMGIPDCLDENNLYSWYCQQIKKGKVKRIPTLNQKVPKYVYYKNGVYNCHRVLRELEQAQAKGRYTDIDLNELRTLVITHN